MAEEKTYLMNGKNFKYKTYGMCFIILTIAVCIVLVVILLVSDNSKPQIYQNLYCFSSNKIFLYIDVNQHAPEKLSNNENIYEYSDESDFEDNKYSKKEEMNSNGEFSDSNQDTSGENSLFSKMDLGANIKSEHEPEFDFQFSDDDTSVDDETIRSNYKYLVDKMERLSNFGIKNLIIPSLPLFTEEVYDVEVLSYLFESAIENNVTLHIMLKDHYNIPIRECKYMSKTFFLWAGDRRPLMHNNKCLLNYKTKTIANIFQSTYNYYKYNNIQSFFYGSYPYTFTKFKDRHQITKKVDVEFLENEANKIRKDIPNVKLYYYFEKDEDIKNLDTIKNSYTGGLLKLYNNIFQGKILNLDLLASFFEGDHSRSKYIMLDLKMIFLQYDSKVLVLGLYLYSPIPIILSAIDEKLEPYFIDLYPYFPEDKNKEQKIFRSAFNRVISIKNNDEYFDETSKYLMNWEFQNGLVIARREKISNRNKYHLIILLYNNSDNDKIIYISKNLKIKNYKSIIVLMNGSSILEYHHKINSDSLSIRKRQTLVLKVLD